MGSVNSITATSLGHNRWINEIEFQTNLPIVVRRVREYKSPLDKFQSSLGGCGDGLDALGFAFGDLSVSMP